MIHSDSYTLSFEIAPPERREKPRVRVLGQLRGEVVTVDAEVTLCEISVGGFSIESKWRFPVGAIHDFRLSLRGSEPVSVWGRVMHSGPRTAPGNELWYQTGFALLEPATGRAAAVLCAFIDDMTSGPELDEP